MEALQSQHVEKKENGEKSLSFSMALEASVPLESRLVVNQPCRSTPLTLGMSLPRAETAGDPPSCGLASSATPDGNPYAGIFEQLCHLREQLFENFRTLDGACTQLEGALGVQGPSMPDRGVTSNFTSSTLMTPTVGRFYIGANPERTSNPSSSMSHPKGLENISELPEECEFQLILQKAVTDYSLGPALSAAGSQSSTLVFRPRHTWLEMPRVRSEGGADEMRNLNSFSSIKSVDHGSRVFGLRRSVSSLHGFNPASSFRSGWHLAGIALIVYDVVMMPMLFFDPPRTPFMDACQWITQLFWTLDLVSNFFVGFYRHGLLIRDVRVIAARYLKTWFVLDFLVVAIDWVMFSIGEGEQSSGGVIRLIKSLRMLRFARMLRLLRLRRLTAFLLYLQDRIFAETAALQYNIMKIGITLLLLNHILACCWYGVGSNNSLHELNWVRQVGIQNWPIFAKYLISLHWSIGQMGVGTIAAAPQNPYEYGFAIFVLIISLFTLTTLVSTVTNLMHNLQQIHNFKDEQLRLVRRFCLERQISKDLSARVQSFLTYADKRRRNFIEESDISIFRLLSKPLADEIHYERYRAVQSHPFFFTLAELGKAGRGVVAMQQIASHAIATMHLAQKDILFSRGDVAKSMYFVEYGECQYTRSREKQENVEVNQWAAEALLWCIWVHMGRLRATVECGLLNIDVPKVIPILVSHYDTWELAKSHAEEFVRLLNEEDRDELTDISGRKTILTRMGLGRKLSRFFLG